MNPFAPNGNPFAPKSSSWLVEILGPLLDRTVRTGIRLVAEDQRLQSFLKEMFMIEKGIMRIDPRVFAEDVVNFLNTIEFFGREKHMALVEKTSVQKPQATQHE